jgi:hypothetical protein
MIGRRAVPLIDPLNVLLEARIPTASHILQEAVRRKKPSFNKDSPAIRVGKGLPPHNNPNELRGRRRAGLWSSRLIGGIKTRNGLHHRKIVL